MLTKKKQCRICKLPNHLWAKKCCKSCYFKAFPPKGIKKKGSWIKPHSEKQIARVKKYQELRDTYLEGKCCEFPGCKSFKTELHHKSGRIGDKLYEDFCALCHTHHLWVEIHPKEAKELELSKNRL